MADSQQACSKANVDMQEALAPLQAIAKQAAAAMKQDKAKLAEVVLEQGSIFPASAAPANTAAQYILGMLVETAVTAVEAHTGSGTAPSDMTDSSQVQGETSGSLAVTLPGESVSDPGMSSPISAVCATSGDPLTDSGLSSCSGSQSDASELMVAELQPVVTEDDISFLYQKCNTAYGLHAERPTARELNLEAEATHGRQMFYKMGAPDNTCLGSYGGVAFQLGCQIDGAHLQDGVAVPTELKNRVKQFPARLPKHELVQVQCQLQLSNACKGLLIERLDCGDGVVKNQQHTILRDDLWWEGEIMPALHAFLKVFALIAEDDEQLDAYLIARSSRGHASHLKRLVKQYKH